MVIPRLRLSYFVPYSRAITYAPGYTIQGGTTQILRNIMGERILGLPREPR